MIYIFDDRVQRRKDNEERLCNYSDLIKFEIITLISEKSVEERIIDSIENPECILFHKSYVFEDNNVTYDTIRQLFVSFNVPIVIFSGGTEGSNKSNVEINMNADLMYNNLPFFLENFRTNGKINIDTLLWGKRHNLNAILHFQNKMSEKYFINQNLEEIIGNVAEVKRWILNSCRKIQKDLGDSIISDIDKDAQITWINLANIIDNNIQKYK